MVEANGNERHSDPYVSKGGLEVPINALLATFCVRAVIGCLIVYCFNFLAQPRGA